MLQAREKLRAKEREGIARSGLGAPKASRPIGDTKDKPLTSGAITSRVRVMRRLRVASGST